MFISHVQCFEVCHKEEEKRQFFKLNLSQNRLDDCHLNMLVAFTSQQLLS